MDYTTGLSRYFKERFTELGGTMALEDVYMTSDQDFSALVARLQSTDGVDGVFASSGPDTAGIIVKQIREAGIDLPILAGDGFDTDLRDQRAGRRSSPTNVYFTTHAYVGPRDRTGRRVPQGLREPSTATRRRTPSPRLATTRWASSPTPSRAPVRPIRPGDQGAGRAPTATRR